VAGQWLTLALPPMYLGIAREQPAPVSGMAGKVN